MTALTKKQNTPEDWEFSGPPITSQYGMVAWKNMKYAARQKFGLSDSEEYNIHAISRDFAKIGLINFNNKVDWPDVDAAARTEPMPGFTRLSKPEME